jgi:hypothetical protein
MAFIHGKNTVVLINAIDISQYTNSTEETDNTTTHENTCYGQTRKTYNAGLGDGSLAIKGVHNDGANNPRAVLKPLMHAGTEVAFIFRPEGTGSGKAQMTVNVLVTSFKQSSPVGENSMWEATLQMTGAISEADQ